MFGSILAFILYLDVNGERVSVAVPDLPRTSATASGPRIAWTQADAEAIVDALTRQGLAGSIPDVLGGLRPHDARRTCLRLDLDTYGEINLDLPGGVERDRAGSIIWTAPQIEAIGKGLETHGLGFLLPRIFGLIQGREADAALTAATPSAPKPLKPACGECLDGHECRVDGVSECCDKGVHLPCMSCKTCFPKLDTSED